MTLRLKAVGVIHYISYCGTRLTACMAISPDRTKTVGITTTSFLLRESTAPEPSHLTTLAKPSLHSAFVGFYLCAAWRRRDAKSAGVDGCDILNHRRASARRCGRTNARWKRAHRGGWRRCRLLTLLAAHSKNVRSGGVGGRRRREETSEEPTGRRESLI